MLTRFAGRRAWSACAVVALSVTVTMLAAANGPAFAAPEEKPIVTSDNPEDGSNVAAELMAQQEPLMNAANRITELDKETTLGGMRLEVMKNTLVVWWKGEPPAEVREEIERQQAEHGITIELAESRYSQRELQEVADSIADSWDSYPGLVGVGPAVDGSGLLVGVTEPGQGEKYGLAVDATFQQMPTVTQLSRRDDSAPWWGGGVTRAAVAGAATCSTGFPVYRRQWYGETSRGILTAAHCSPGGNVPFNDGVGQRIGIAEASTYLPWADALYIKTSSQGRIFDGGVGVGEFSKPVVGTNGNLPGQFVCTTGAATGVHCNISIQWTNFYHFLFPSGRLVLSSVAFQVNGGIAAGSGDSGGPVFELTADPSKTRAVGMITGGWGQVPCALPGVQICTNQVTFTNIYFALGATGTYILTS